MGIRELFSESPFEPLRQHMDKVKEAVDLVLPMFERVRAACRVGRCQTRFWHTAAYGQCVGLGRGSE